MTKVILVNGPARSGKDTLAEFLTNGRFTSDNSPYYFPHQTYPFKFAGVMHQLWKDIFLNITEEDDFNDWVDGSRKNETHPFLGCSYREAMIDFSENYIKPRYGINFFGRLTAEEIAQSQKFFKEDIVAVVSDSGFKEEAVSIIEKFGAENVLLVKLYRDGYSFNGDSRNYIDLEEFGVKTVEIENITLDQFRRDAILLIREFVEA